MKTLATIFINDAENLTSNEEQLLSEQLHENGFFVFTLENYEVDRSKPLSVSDATPAEKATKAIGEQIFGTMFHATRNSPNDTGVSWVTNTPSIMDTVYANATRILSKSMRIPPHVDGYYLTPKKIVENLAGRASEKSLQQLAERYNPQQKVPLLNGLIFTKGRHAERGGINFLVSGTYLQSAVQEKSETAAQDISTPGFFEYTDDNATYAASILYEKSETDKVTDSETGIVYSTMGVQAIRDLQSFRTAAHTINDPQHQLRFKTSTGQGVGIWQPDWVHGRTAIPKAESALEQDRLVLRSWFLGEKCLEQ